MKDGSLRESGADGEGGGEAERLAGLTSTLSLKHTMS